MKDSLIVTCVFPDVSCTILGSALAMWKLLICRILLLRQSCPEERQVYVK